MPLLQQFFAGRGLQTGLSDGGLAGVSLALTAHASLAATDSFRGPLAELRYSALGGGAEPTLRQGADGPQFESPDIPNNTSTTATITVGGPSVIGTVNTVGDDDWYAVELVAGQSYVFTLVGSGGSPLLDPYLELRNEFGGLMSVNDDSGPGYTSLLRFTAVADGTYYINARAFEPVTDPAYQTGQYSLTAAIGAPQNPLDTIDYNWTVPTTNIQVYFATTGETFGPDNADRNWTQAEIDAVFAALETYENIAPLTFSQTFNQAEAEFTIMLTSLDPNVLGYFIPSAGIGAFSPNTTSWTTPGSLLPGGSAFGTLIHEFGHALGLAHPHDEGGVRDENGDGSSEIMQGVTDAFASPGTFMLNQGVFTIMSYRDGFYDAPFGQNNSNSTGSSATPMALDIAMIQSIYGVNNNFHNADDSYALTGSAGAFICLWDTGGTDSISYGGSGAATIDLRAATLQNQVGGGGYVSYVFNVHQGFTIANGVVIENANGGSGNDTLSGNSSNNTLNGGAGADAMIGRAGDDTYVVDNAGDTVTENAGEGTDTVQTSVTHTLTLDVENLTLTGSANINGTGNAANNIITGNSGNNTLNGGTGADAMSGGGGNDTYVVDNAGDTATEGASAGTDEVQASVSFALSANVENLLLTGGGDINGTGNVLNNTLTGNFGANILNGGAGADAMTGGAGNDTYVVDDAGDTVTESASFGTDTVQASISYTLGSEVENLTLIGAALNGTGNGLNNTLVGNGNANTLDGGAGADAMSGGGGDDTYLVDNSGDTVGEAGGGGTDNVQASVTFTLGGNIENLTLTGGGAINGFGNILNNSITGNGAANQLNGFDGADTLDGAGGADSMFGGNGDDSYFVDNAGDLTTEVSALGGTDIVFSSVTRNLTANIENLTLTGVAAITASGNSMNNVLTGNSAANTLYGFDGNDTLDGGAGGDTLFGANGDDTYIVDHVDDITVEGSPSGGVDTVLSSISRNLNANFENLTLTGTAQFGYGNILGNVMTGNASANGLYGLDGNDRLDGGAGADQMFGANGDDTYVVDNASDVTSEVSVSGGTDTVESSVARNLTANLENLILTGTDAINGAGNTLNNVITGNVAVNTLFGLDGADRLDGGLGADTLQGGPGADTYVFSSALGGGNVDTLINYSVADDTIELNNAVFTGLGAGALDAGAFHIGVAATDAAHRIIYDNGTGALYFDADGDGAGAAIQFATLAAGLALTNNDFIVFGP